jgi:hypothetical protein
MNRVMPLLAVVGTAVFLITLRAPAAEPTADDYITFCSPQVGTWKMTNEVGGRVDTGTFRYRLAANKKCYRASFEGGGFPAMEQVEGYDPVAKKGTMAGFDVDGGFVLSTVDVPDLKNGKVMGVGVFGNWQEKRFGPDGKTTTSTSTLSCTEVGRDRIVFIWSNRKENGKPLPDFKMTLERQ